MICKDDDAAYDFFKERYEILHGFDALHVPLVHQKYADANTSVPSLES